MIFWVSIATRDFRRSCCAFRPCADVRASGDGLGMFDSQELIVDAGFAAARARLARMVADGGLTGVSRDAYQGTLTRLIRVGPFGAAPGISKQVQVRLIGPVRRDATTAVWLRWEATGPAGGLFPVLDADLLLRSEGLERTRMTLKACYRPPLGRLGAGLDWALLHRVATATIRTLLRGIADTLTEPEQVPARHQNGTGSAALLLPARTTDTLSYAAPDRCSSSYAHPVAAPISRAS